MIPVMIVSLGRLLGWLVSAFRSREDLVLENLALRRQLLALHAQRPRHRLTALHKLFWVALRTCWSGWRKPLILVEDTITIRHTIPIPSGLPQNGGSDDPNGQNYLLRKRRDHCSLRGSYLTLRPLAVLR
jgi:hypothetical protein